MPWPFSEDAQRARCSSSPLGCPWPKRLTWSGTWPGPFGYPDALRRADALARPGPSPGTQTGRPGHLAN